MSKFIIFDKIIRGFKHYQSVVYSYIYPSYLFYKYNRKYYTWFAF